MFQNQQNKASSDGTNHLLEKARSGDRGALGELIDQHYHLVQRTAYRILKNTADAEDVTQEVSLKVLFKLHTFEGQSAFSTWLTRIAINESLMFLRKSRRMALCQSIKPWIATAHRVPNSQRIPLAPSSNVSQTRS